MTIQQKRNLLLASLTACLLLIIYIIMPQGGGVNPGEEESLLVYSMDADTVTGLSFGGKEDRISLLRKDGGWVYAEDEAFPLNQNFVDTMLEKTARLTARRLVAEGSGHFGEYGLDRPSNMIVVTADTGTKTIYLGNINSATGDRYMAVEGTGKIYTVDATFSNLFSGGLNDMAKRETLPDISLDRMVRVTVEEKGQRFAFIGPSQDAAARAASGNDSVGTASENISAGSASGNDKMWTVSENDGPAMPADDGLVSERLGKLAKLRYEELKVYRPLAEQMTEYGFLGDGTGGLIRIAYHEGPGRKGNENAVSEFVMHMGGDSADGLHTYVYPEGGQGIYTVKKDSLNPLLHLTAGDFLSLSIAPVKADNLARLTLKWEEGQAEFEIIRPEYGRSTIYTLNGQEITEAKFNAFYFPLYGFTAEKRISDMAGQLTGSPVLTIAYNCVPGTRENLTVELIPYDRNYYGAMVNGQAFLLVNRQRVNRLMNEVRKLPL